MLIFDQVSKQIGQTNILENVSFAIRPQEFVSIIGPSGAGKSTIINMITGFSRPTSGEVKIDDIKINKLRGNRLQMVRRKMGVVFQDYKLLPRKTVAENVGFAMEVCGADEEEISKKVAEVLEIVGLSHRMGEFPATLSGGERQRAAIARALAHNPALLLADEPTGNLDPATAWGIMELLQKINGLGTTVILTTHNPAIVDRLQKRVIRIDGGKIVSDQQNASY